MPKKIFISYSHSQGKWVLDALVPVLDAGGAEVLIDRQRFEAGKAVVRQMDAVQDEAAVHVLVLSPEYLTSDYCVHEMERAVECDPEFEGDAVIPVLRRDCDLPDLIRRPNPLYVDLRKDRDAEPWDALLRVCGADLGIAVPDWLVARNDVRRFLDRGQSVNLVVSGDKVAWKQLIDHLAQVDLQNPSTASRRGLVQEIVRACGSTLKIPDETDEDLAALGTVLSNSSGRILALTHFDLAAHRKTYGVDLFASLRYLTMELRKLVLLVQSRTPFAALLPDGHPLSEIDIKTVELRGR